MVIFLWIPIGSFQVALVNRAGCENAQVKERVEFFNLRVNFLNSSLKLFVHT